MATKDISDFTVCKAYLEYRNGKVNNIIDYLVKITKQPSKVCYRAMERAYSRDLIEVGVSLNSAWLTQKGKELLKNA